MTINEQVVSILIMIISGLFVGAIVDSTRYLLSTLSPGSFLRKIGYGVELIVWVLLGGLTFYILFIVKGGEWRLVDPLAQILGIFLYESVFQRYFRFVGRVFVLLTIRPILAIIKFIYSVIIGTIRLLLRIIMFLFTPFRKIYIIIKKKYLLKIYSRLRRILFKKR
ncbi:spore cortex protein YabQ [Ureibacillus xyleni]|uniref:Spore cortex protein YabQ n=1 Tax=Ureibacillus xyleni TaxID=614648 RepID=A0A285TRS1_9BACL|nr:spore cortex protein YabQ [Ureibacillus xyleni]